MGVKIAFATKHIPVLNHITIGIVGVEIKCLINQYVIDVEFEWDSWLLCDLKSTVCVA